MTRSVRGKTETILALDTIWESNQVKLNEHNSTTITRNWKFLFFSISSSVEVYKFKWCTLKSTNPCLLNQLIQNN